MASGVGGFCPSLEPSGRSLRPVISTPAQEEAWVRGDCGPRSRPAVWGHLASRFCSCGQRTGGTPCRRGRGWAWPMRTGAVDRHPAAPTCGRKEQALARATPRNAVASQRHPRLGIRAPGTTRLWETLELKGISGSESPDPVGGGVSSEPVHSTTPPPGTRFSVSRARLVLRRRIGDAVPARGSQALWASFPSGALGPHSCFSSVPWGMQTGPAGTDGISKVSPLLPPQSPTRRDMVETEQIGANASVSSRNPGAAGHRRVPHGSADRRSRGPGRGW